MTRSVVKQLQESAGNGVICTAISKEKSFRPVTDVIEYLHEQEDTP